MAENTYVVWFRNDFRQHDQPAVSQALTQAVEEDGKLLFVFHLHPDFTDEIDMSRDYFFQTLSHFAEQCENAGTPLRILSGSPKEAFNSLLQEEQSIHTVYFSRDFTPFAAERDKEVKEVLDEHQVKMESVRGNYIHEPEEILKDDGTPYKVYTPYAKQWMKKHKSAMAETDTEKLSAYYLTPKEKNKENGDAFAKVLDKCNYSWKRIGEENALDRLKYFTKNVLNHYHETRDLPEKAGTSRLSPYLRTGALSVRQVYEACAPQLDKKQSEGAETFIKELAWRDFYAMILHHFPETATEEFQAKYRSLTWNTDKEQLQLWQEGKTGFPIVDAGMRQLNKIGWMHNRLRMITASFLTKDYQIDWREGDAYFAKKLIDHDPASNLGGWQWAGSVGTDAVPYFRVFSPIRQAERFDPDGSFIRKYVPELKNVPDKYIHEPHKMPKKIQEEASCIIGKDYPEQSVDHKLQRKRAIAMFTGDDEK